MSRQIIGAILTLYFGVAISFTAVQLLTEYDHEKERLNNQIKAIANTFQPAIIEALWNYDEQQVSASMQGLYRNPEIYGVQISSTDNDSWTLGYYHGTKRKKQAAPIEQNLELINGDLPQGKVLDFTSIGTRLYHTQIPLLKQSDGKEELIGYQSLYFSSVTIYQRIWYTFVITIIGAFIKTVALCVITFWVINKFITKPFRQIIVSMHNYDIDQSDVANLKPIKLNNNTDNELNFLATSFNTLQKSITKKNNEIRCNETGLEELIKFKTENLEQAKKDLEEANRVKSDFLATMSHEIRTPMNAILGSVQLLQRTDCSDKQNDLLKKINTSSKNLLVIINDILDFSKIEANKLELESTPVNIKQLVTEVIESFSALAAEKKLMLVKNYSDNLAACDISGDPTRLSQVINNLLSNAIKFTHEGSIIVSLEATPHENQSNITISVQDTGIGMTEEQQDSLFKKFTQADSSTTRNFGGTGLGLSICKNLIELMGGQIVVESIPQMGTKFTISLCLPMAEIQTAPKSESNDCITHQSGTILMVDDIEVNREIASMMLEDAGYEVLFAENGLVACELIESRHNTIDAVLLDCQMPVMDGFDAARRVRNYEQSHSLSRLPVIALTASAMIENQKSCEEAGMDDFLAKPIDEIQMLQTISNHLSQKQL